jgi:hypothetical protein
MKFAAAILNRFSRSKADAPDAFELRLINMGSESKVVRRARHTLPTLFLRTNRGVA